MTHVLDIEPFLRPSSLAAVALCNGRPTMEAAVVAQQGAPEPTSEAAEGTDLHRRAQQAIESWKLCQETGERHALWGDCIADHCNQATEDGLSSWAVWCLQFALERVRDLISKYDIHPDNILTEHHMAMEGLGFANGGTADVVLVIPFKRVIVIDYKFGFLDQGDADQHDQLQAYAIAAADEFRCEDVEVWIIQPRAEKPHRMSGGTFDATSLRANRTWTQAVLLLARGPNPELVAGYSQCTYCKAFTRCPAAKEKIVQAQQALQLIGAPSTPDELGQAADDFKLAEKWGAEGKDGIKEHLLKNGPGSVTGWKLGSGRAIRSVADMPRALERLREAGLVDAAAPAMSISVGKMEPMVADLLADQVVEHTSAPSLVQDKRAKRGVAA